MSSPVTANLTGNLLGSTKQGALTPIPLAYSLDAQAAHQQLSIEVESGETKPVSIPSNLGGPVATPDGQTLFILTCDVPDVAVTLNALGAPVGPFEFVKAGGVLVLPGTINSLPVTDLSIVNTGLVTACLSVTAVYGS